MEEFLKEEYLRSDQKKSNRSEKKFWIVFALFAFIILVSQILQFINTKIIDNKHKAFITEKNAILRASQSALVQSSTVQRMLLNLSIPNNAEEKDVIKKRLIEAAINNERDLMTIINASSSYNGEDPLVSQMKEASSDYRNNYIAFIKLLSDGDYKKASQYRVGTLRHSLELYQGLQQKLLVKITSETVDESERISSYTSISGWVLFVIGIFPYLYILFALRHTFV